MARFTTPYVGETYGQTSVTSYYAVLIDAEATDLTVSNGAAAVSIVKYTAGSGLSTLASATASAAASAGVVLGRGRWYTVTAVTSPNGIQVRITRRLL